MRIRQTPFIIALCFILIASCKQEEIPTFIRETVLKIRYIDANGNDLLNPATNGAFTQERINIYYLNNGQLEPVAFSTKQEPGNFTISQDSGKYYLQLFPSEYFPNSEKINHTTTTTLITFNQTDTDTVTTSLFKNEQHVFVNRVRYNSALVWDEDSPTIRSFEIVK